MTADNPIYRTGDKIVIVEPAVFVRVGYPLSLAAAREHVEKLVATDLFAVFRKAGANIGGLESFTDGLPGNVFVNNRDYDTAVNAVAHAYLKAQNFGGQERAIHTLAREELRGKLATVVGKRFVKTGTYHRGYTGYDGDGEPPTLRKVKTHVLLEVEPGDLFDMPFEIEACHVRSADNPESCGDCDPCLGGRPDQCAVNPLVFHQ